ncbi:DUF3090 family protein [Mobilicoccus pelagius]|uniref:DUF3090 domain-containing protein n=1 Tax=Mobilicoccus pelagius NBRC 104925 TaxID=1089455 RepID=H5UTH5_9MICO|nr:DUF3090 family protein [Mobilicoccus pelagius]GAB49033.1 hypothetical protein MOPEL_096_00400 [Mobilicoccus pelagius NBRC 104925]
MAVIDYDPPERFVAGTVGPPGQRQFYLQASGGGRVTSVACEKAQVAVLAERIDDLLEEYAPDVEADDLVDNAPLDMPLTEEFVVGTIRLDWDPLTQRLVLHLVPVGEEVDETTDLAVLDTLSLRVSMDARYARSFANRSTKVVSAGRPPCPFCGAPLDPAGHVCPRANGYKR